VQFRLGNPRVILQLIILLFVLFLLRFIGLHLCQPFGLLVFLCLEVVSHVVSHCNSKLAVQSFKDSNTPSELIPTANNSVVEGVGTCKDLVLWRKPSTVIVEGLIHVSDETMGHFDELVLGDEACNLLL
jgi:hypothetical protein